MHGNKLICGALRYFLATELWQKVSIVPVDWTKRASTYPKCP